MSPLNAGSPTGVHGIITDPVDHGHVIKTKDGHWDLNSTMAGPPPSSPPKNPPNKGIPMKQRKELTIWLGRVSGRSWCTA